MRTATMGVTVSIAPKRSPARTGASEPTPLAPASRVEANSGSPTLCAARSRASGVRMSGTAATGLAHDLACVTSRRTRERLPEPIRVSRRPA